MESGVHGGGSLGARHIHMYTDASISYSQDFAREELDNRGSISRAIRLERAGLGGMPAPKCAVMERRSL